jgi:hypothetical protein
MDLVTRIHVASAVKRHTADGMRVIEGQDLYAG